MEAFDEKALAARQHELDVDKWLASEAAGYDLCGSFTFCARCEKFEQHPCARAEVRWLEEQAREEEAFGEEQEVTEENPELLTPEEAEEEAVEPEAAVEEDEAAGDEEIAAAEAPAEDEEEGSEEASAAEASAEDEEEGPEEASAAAEGPEEANEDEPAAADAPEEDVPAAPPAMAEVPAGYEFVTRYRRSFKSRLIQDEKMQDFYTDIKNAFAELTGVKARLSRHCENFRFHAGRIAKLNVGGKTLTLYLALDPQQYEDTKYRYEDVSDRKTYAETPMKVRITSKRMVKYARELLADLAQKYGITITGTIPMDYHYKYQSDEALIKKGLIKPYEVLVKKKKK